MQWPSLHLPIALLPFFFFCLKLSLGMSRKNKQCCCFQLAPGARGSHGGSRVQVGGCSSAFLHESRAQLSLPKVTQVGTAGPSAGFSGQSCAAGCRAVCKEERPGSQWQETSQGRGAGRHLSCHLLSEVGNLQLLLLCPVCVQVHKVVIW